MRYIITERKLISIIENAINEIENWGETTGFNTPNKRDPRNFDVPPADEDLPYLIAKLRRKCIENGITDKREQNRIIAPILDSMGFPSDIYKWYGVPPLE